MKKIYHLKTCDTCKKILDKLDLSGVELQDIKSEFLTEVQLQEMYVLSGSYQSLFNKRAKLYREKDLKNKELGEKDYKQYLLEAYTFLKRPVAIIDNEIYIGNSKNNVEALINILSKKDVI